ncbi:MAG: NAD(P)-binding domain-containing protein, partial [Planctomycetaceae bacterium]
MIDVVHTESTGAIDILQRSFQMQHTPQTDVGVIGLGLLGTALCERLQSRGYTAWGLDIDPARRRHHTDQERPLATGVDDLTASCSRIILSLPDATISLQVIADLASSLAPGAIVIDTTTGGPKQMQACGKRLEEKGVRYLDATVGGSSLQVRQGAAIVMVGGAPTTVIDCRDLLDCFASRTFHLGPVGSGARMKLALNLV